MEIMPSPHLADKLLLFIVVKKIDTFCTHLIYKLLYY